jgi:hypothetical protein
VVIAVRIPHAMSLPENGFSLGLPDAAGSMVTQYYYDLPDDHMLPQTFPLQLLCHGPRLPDASTVPWLCDAAAVIHQHLSDATANTSRNTEVWSSLRPVMPTNLVDKASTASEFYDDLTQGLVENMSAAMSFVKCSLPDK